MAFEDLDHFSKVQLWDIKKNGHPDTSFRDDSDWDSEEETYGGDGRDTNSNGLHELEDYGNIPGFSDQVIDVALQEPV